MPLVVPERRLRKFCGCGWVSSHIGARSVEISEFSEIRGKIGPTSADSLQWADIWPEFAPKSGRNSTWGRLRPKLAEISRACADVGRIWPGFARSWAKCDRNWSSLACIGRTRASLTPNRPTGRTFRLPKFDRHGSVGGGATRMATHFEFSTEVA